MFDKYRIKTKARILLFGMIAVGIFGCLSVDEKNALRAEEVEPEIHRLLLGYLPTLGKVYASGKIENLAPWSVKRHQLQVDKRIYDLMKKGYYIEAEMLSFEILEVVSWNFTNTYVTTRETWDVRYYSTGSQQLVSEVLGRTDRAKYHIHWSGERWEIYDRQLIEVKDDD